MEAKVKIIEREECGEKMVDIAHSYTMNCSTTGMILKSKDKDTPGGTVVGNPPANAEAVGQIPDMRGLHMLRGS